MKTPRLLALSPSPNSPLKPSQTILPPQTLHPHPSTFLHCCYTKKPPLHNSTSRKRSYWDSNAETSRSNRFKFFDDDSIGDDDDEDYDADSRFRWSENRRKKRKWWSDNDDDDDFEDSNGGVIEDVIENVWFIKVLRSFGWLLPAILITMLVSSGPKAFLMAIALPLGQSLVSYAFDKVFGRTQDRPKRRPRSKRKPFVRPSSTVDISEEEEIDENGEGKKPYQSWVGTENGSVQQNMGPQKPSFGGWDELDNADTKKRQKRQTKGGAPLGQGMEKVKIRRRGRQRDTPLFLRLLISVFPFLGSWTRLL
ncbi:hypothetical protein ACHQM5_014309 [Ranunculus cassubicifolius]